MSTRRSVLRAIEIELREALKGFPPLETLEMRVGRRHPTLHISMFHDDPTLPIAKRTFCHILDIDDPSLFDQCVELVTIWKDDLLRTESDARVNLQYIRRMCDRVMGEEQYNYSSERDRDTLFLKDGTVKWASITITDDILCAYTHFQVKHIDEEGEVYLDEEDENEVWQSEPTKRNVKDMIEHLSFLWQAWEEADASMDVDNEDWDDEDYY